MGLVFPIVLAKDQHKSLIHALIIMSELQNQLSAQGKLPRKTQTHTAHTHTLLIGTHIDRQTHTDLERWGGRRLQFKLGPAGFLVPGPSAQLRSSEWSRGQEEIKQGLRQNTSQVQEASNLNGWMQGRGLGDDESLLNLPRAWPQWPGPTASTIHVPILLQMLRARLN